LDLIRLLFWALIGWLLILGVRKLTAGGKTRAGGGADSAVSPATAEDMVRCATCRLNLPKSEAVPFEGGWACCAEHARAPAARP
jgi:uncharacterized protein